MMITQDIRRRLQTLLDHFKGDIMSDLDLMSPPPQLWSNVDLDQEYKDFFPGTLMMWQSHYTTEEDEIEDELEYYRNIHMYEPEYHDQDTI